MVKETIIPKGYKQSDAGVIPEEWEARKLGEIANAQGGYAFSSKKFLVNGKYQVVKMSNLYGGVLDLDRSQSFLDDLDLNERQYMLRKGDILITLTGTVGKTDYGYSHRIDNESNLLLNQRVGRILGGSSANPAYLGYVCKTPRFLQQFFEKSKGGTGNQANVGTTDIENVFIPFPPTKGEQIAIATVLSDTDRLIAALDELTAKKLNIMHGAMQELLAGKRRLPGFSGDWEDRSLKNCGKLTMGQSPPGDSYNSNDIGMPLLNGAADLKEDRIIITQYTTMPTRFSKKGDLLFCIRATIGNLQISDKEYCLGRGVAALCVNDSCNKAFVALQLQGLFAIMRHQSQGGVIKGLRKDELAEMTIKIPKQIDEQTAIAKILVDMSVEIEALKQKLDKCKIIKQGMAQVLLTGKVRLI